ncbi:ligase-associated DNA damage response endonuclease PdeM [Flavobacterium sp. CBA20B-1]|uniref:ligase-associated DNA damage response endonuclease PdeM n=1 Tax=unclassified Flavobacterium TaxID=196869 RepID=UPI00222479BA|nr:MULTISPECIES: ligase-associated DNA damage response endonuclease PdeM [unclassified Flavobacterium]WCM41831.1 ligase-associated DNA damage response endonuclease PdeM [Flavobacterium sp. CBA20B-1]
MKIIEKLLHFGGQEFLLNNQRSMFWPALQTLIFSDLHSGKSAYFRKNGIAMPSYLHTLDLQRLKNLILHYQPKNILIVGDLIHAGNNKEVTDLKQLIAEHDAINFQLVKGNHDRLPDSFIKSLGFKNIYQHLEICGILVVHEPIENQKLPAISGHLHPGVQIPLLKNKSKRLPCFMVQKNQLILPAFSGFTGMAVQKTKGATTFYGFYESVFFVVQED